MQFEDARGAANGDGIKPGALHQHILSGEGDFCFGPAHDPPNAHGARTVAVANHTNAGGKHALDAVEGANFLRGLGAADNDTVVAHFVVVEGVERMPELKHHVIAYINHVIDAGDARGFEALL